MSEPQVSPNFKQGQGPCECDHPGCEAFGTLKKPWFDTGTRCVARKCRCRRCIGFKSRARGKRSQAKAAKALGIPVSPLRPGHEELAAGALRFENKAGKGDAGPVITRFRASRAQSEAARPIADHRPFVATFEHDGLLLFVIDANDALDFAAALLENHAGDAA